MMDKTEKLISLLKEKKITIGSVESLTAGLFGSSLCSIPGASAVYKGGIITYSPSLKTSLVDVPAELIEEKGVVSIEVAKAMAEGGLKKMDVDLCVSFTGNAGPTAEKGEAPVGMVCMAIARKDKETYTFSKIFKGDRNKVRTECINEMVKRIIDLCS